MTPNKQEDIMSSEQVETPAEFCEWLVSMNALSNVGSRGLVTLSNIIERADLALRALTPAPQVVETVEGRDAIPVGTVVRSASGTIGCRYDGHRGLVFGEDVAFEWSLLALPLTVLYPHPTPDVLAEVRACGAVWVCPEDEWSDNAYAGTWTCALPLSHGGPHVELTQGIRWQERGRRSDSIGEFYPPNATLDGEAGR